MEQRSAQRIRRVNGFDVTVGMHVRRLSAFVRVNAIMPIDDLNVRRLLDDNGDTITVTNRTFVEVLTPKEE